MQCTCKVTCQSKVVNIIEHGCYYAMFCHYQTLKTYICSEFTSPHVLDGIRETSRILLEKNLLTHQAEIENDYK